MAQHIIWWSAWIAAISCAVDFWTYPSRQSRWEEKHPGEVYIRHYKKLLKKGVLQE